ncbi:MAG TPA: TonB family protein [Bryobacteraceae bacterium]|nr:TonB family protein [Bryobacteraceae bacterium]
METVVHRAAEDELHFLTEWGNPADRSRKREAGIISILVHAAVIVLLLVVPGSLFEPSHRAPEPPVVTTLIAPPTELTQKAPNPGKIQKRFEVPTIAPRPRAALPEPAPAPPRARFQLRQPAAPQPAAPPGLPAPPQMEAATKETPRNQALPIPQPTPQILPAEPPKMALENPEELPSPVPPEQRRLPMPDTSVSGAIHQLSHDASSAGMVIGNPDVFGSGSYGGGLNLPPSPGLNDAAMMLKSDPEGVDFRPYLLRVLAAVRRNWMAVMPESVRLGRRGVVEIEFSVDRGGAVPKLVIAQGSGTEALDRAAVAGISASNPFPPLPTEFKGDRIVLRFRFAYNMPRR